MIATVLQNRNADGIWEALEDCEMAEIRLDKCDLSLSEIEEIFSTDVPLVATCRIGANMSVPQSEKRLIKAIQSGARFVDVEIEAPKEMSKRVRSCAHENGTVFIRSFHDFNGTGSVADLKAVVDKCRYHGADMVKVVTTAHSQDWTKTTKRMFRIFEKMDLQPVITPKLLRPEKCINCGHCAIGCPTGAKWDTRELIAETVAAGANLITGCCVEKLLIKIIR